MQGKGWGLVRDVIRLFMDHHTWKIARTEAARLADPDYQKEAPSVSELKAAALGAPSGSRKTTRRERQNGRRPDGGGGGGGGGGGAKTTSPYGPAAAVDDDVQAAAIEPQKPQQVRPRPQQQDGCRTCGGRKCVLGRVKAQGIAGACMWGVKYGAYIDAPKPGMFVGLDA